MSKAGSENSRKRRAGPRTSDRETRRERRERLRLRRAKRAPGPTWFQSKKPVIRFVLLFGAILCALSACVSNDFALRKAWPPYLRLNARATSAILQSLGQAASTQGWRINGPGFSLEVVRGCDAIHPSFLFAAAVFAFPVSVRSRLAGACIGTAIILATNLARIVSLYYVRLHLPDAYDVMHLEVWQLTFILLAVVLWAIWVRWAIRRSVTVTHARA